MPDKAIVSCEYVCVTCRGIEDHQQAFIDKINALIKEDEVLNSDSSVVCSLRRS